VWNDALQSEILEAQGQPEPRGQGRHHREPLTAAAPVPPLIQNGVKEVTRSVGRIRRIPRAHRSTGKKVASAGRDPVECSGLCCRRRDVIVAVSDERTARQIATSAPTGEGRGQGVHRITLRGAAEADPETGEVKEATLITGDVQGSVRGACAIASSKLSTEEVKLKVIPPRAAHQ